MAGSTPATARSGCARVGCVSQGFAVTAPWRKRLLREHQLPARSRSSFVMVFFKNPNICLIKKKKNNPQTALILAKSMTTLKNK